MGEPVGSAEPQESALGRTHVGEMLFEVVNGKILLNGTVVAREGSLPLSEISWAEVCCVCVAATTSLATYPIYRWASNDIRALRDKPCPLQSLQMSAEDKERTTRSGWVAAFMFCVGLADWLKSALLIWKVHDTSAALLLNA